MREIPGFPDYYATEDGNIISIKSGKPKAMKGTPSHAGYLVVNLFVDGVSHARKVHRLVLESFVGPCPDLMECCHNNANRTDNRLANLRWGTKLSNAEDRAKHGNATKKLTAPQALEIYRSVETARVLANRFGVSQETVRVIRNGKSWAWLSGHKGGEKC